MSDTSVSSKKSAPKIFYGYIIVAVSLFILVVMHGITGTYSVFFGSLQQELSANRATIASANSLSSILGGLSGIILGRMTDRFGPKMIIAISGIVLTIGFLLMSRLTSLWQLYLFYSFIIGVGSSSGNVALLSTTTRWFIKKRGLMSGIVKVGTGIGMFIMPVVAGLLISSYGWRQALIALGIIGIVGIVPISFMLKRDPSEIGLKPYGYDEPLNITSKSNGVQLSQSETIRTRQFWTLCAMYFLIGYITQSIMIHIVPFGTDSGIPIVQAALTASIIGGVSIAGRLVIGTSIDKFGDKRALIVCFIILITALSFLQVVRNQWMLYLFALIYGFSHGGFYTITSPIVAELFGTKSHGANYGLVLFISSAGSAIGPIITGLMFDTLKSYYLAFMILIAVAASALTLCLTIKPVQIKQLQ